MNEKLGYCKANSIITVNDESKKYSKLARIYTISSIFIGPFIILLGTGFTRGGGDYCDSVYYLSDGTIDPRRITEFNNAQIFQVSGASLMLVLGLGIIIYTIFSIKKASKINIWPLLGVIIMMFGYILVILSSGKGTQSC
ncbi:hypothetical protein IPL68_00250 [Candidatus Saccharibacteria bacterium]|nr:MAG: hypothetical protein IPL68_00250 [Candidatus Saccharibacteria bacterium]